MIPTIDPNVRYVGVASLRKLNAELLQAYRCSASLFGVFGDADGTGGEASMSDEAECWCCGTPEPPTFCGCTRHRCPKSGECTACCTCPRCDPEASIKAILDGAESEAP